MAFIKENWSAIIFTILVHVMVLALFAVNIDFDPEPPKPVKSVAVQAKIINGAAIDAEVKRQEKIEKDILDAEVKRQKDAEDKVLQAKKERETEEKRIADLKAQRIKQEAEDKKHKLEQAAKLKQDQLAAKKKADAEKKKLADAVNKRKIEEANLAKLKQDQLVAKKKAAEEEAKRVAAVAAKKKADEEAKKKAAAEAKKKADALAAKKKKEADDKRKAEEAEAARVAALEADLAAAMADEESLNEVIDDGGLNRYQTQISQYIERNWRKPPSAQEGLRCILDVKQIPGGEVVAISFSTCNADEATKASIEQAVFKASPLPEPEDPRLFARDLEIIFAPEI